MELTSQYPRWRHGGVSPRWRGGRRQPRPGESAAPKLQTVRRRPHPVTAAIGRGRHPTAGADGAPAPGGVDLAAPKA